LVCVDGSDAAHEAFELVTKCLMKSTDLITVAHIFNRDKHYLPLNMQPDSIKQTYESLIIGYGKRAFLIWEEKDNKLTTKEHMTEIQKRTQCDVVVVGMHGRKGPKE
jgi:hypothetical protein